LKQGGYKLSVQSNDIIRRADEGGIYGDPLDDLYIERGSLVINFYGGSAWRWDYRLRFRFQENGWFLIGMIDLSYNNLDGKSTEYDYNLLTGKMSKTTGNYLDEKAKKTVKWSTPGKKKLLIKQYHAWLENEWPKIAPSV
jgi:hypothetical protein